MNFEKKLFTCFVFNLEFEAEKRTAVYGNQPRSWMCIKKYKDMHKQKPKETKEEKKKKKRNQERKRKK